MSDIAVSFVHEIVHGYFVCAISILLFIYFLLHNKLHSAFVQKCFLAAVISITMLALVENLERLVAMNDDLVPLRIMLSVIGYICRSAIPFFISLIPGRKLMHKWIWFNIIPLAFSVVVSYSAVFTDICFSYNSANEFVRGPLGYVPFIVAGFYLLEIILFSIRKFYFREYQEGLMCICFGAVIAAAAYLEMTYEIGGLVVTSSMVCMLFYYLFFTIEHYTSDQLTDAFIRNKFFLDLDKLRDISYIVSIDMNGLKQTNDRLGHAAGDAALKTMAEAFIRCLPRKARFYRIGGDEFAIIYSTEDSRKIDELLARVRELLADSVITFSAGYALIKEGKTYEESLKEADDLMYEEKRRYHHING